MQPLTRTLAAGLALCALATALLGAERSQAAAPDPKKAMWGPVFEFDEYAELGVGIYQYGISWDLTAPTRPANPTDPNDPAYIWPADFDHAVSEAQKYGISISVQLLRSPSWANGGRPYHFAPNAKDFAAFATAAARRYPTVKIWQIWGEPTLTSRFAGGKKSSRPRRYAKILDGAYGVLKAVDPANLVVGGMSITRGSIKTLDWIKQMELPNGKPPRMDLYGHNPFSARKPNLRKDPQKRGQFDISDLDTLIKSLDEFLARGGRNKKLRVFISEWTIPTDHRGQTFDFWADRGTQANYLGRAMRIVRSMRRVFTFGWFYLTDEPANGAGTENNWGLITTDGVRKPAYFVYRDG